MNRFRLLYADEIECRIAQVKEGKGLSLLLYKTARTDANLLDETVGPENWQNDFKIIDGVLYGGIGIFYEDKGWIWKWDAGTESNTEAEKGRASDAFKRAGFKHGIGRELYSSPFIWIPASKCNIQNGKCYDRFTVQDIGYDSLGEISKLVIADSKGKEVFRKSPTIIEIEPGHVAASIIKEEGPKATKEEIDYIVENTTPEQLKALLKVESYEKDGRKRSEMRVIASDIDLLGRKEKGFTPTSEPDPFQDEGEQEGLPF